MTDTELKQALRKMLQTELDAMRYYQQASRYMQDEGAIYHFNQLAQEELEHARTFYDVYPGDELPEFEEMVKSLPEQPAHQQRKIQLEVSRLNEKRALQLAIELERSVARELQQMLKEVYSPAARAAIEKNIESTRGHLELIEEDFQRLFAED